MVRESIPIPGRPVSLGGLKLDGATADLGLDTGLPVMCYDTVSGTFMFLRCTPSGLVITGDVNTVTTPTITIKNIPLADTEVSQALPANTKKFKIQSRGDAIVRLAYTSGDTLTDYWTIFPGCVVSEENISAASTTIYLSSSKAGEDIEILSWA